MLSKMRLIIMPSEGGLNYYVLLEGVRCPQALYVHKIQSINLPIYLVKALNLYTFQPFIVIFIFAY